MNKNLKWKALLVTIITGAAFWLVYPPFDIHDKNGKVTEEGKINLGLDLQGGMHIVLEVDTSALKDEEKKDAPERALEIIRNRLDEFGVAEPHIQKQGINHIIVELPGLTDRDRALEIVGKTAHLEFKLASDDPELMKKALNGDKVEGYELQYMQEGKKQSEPILLEEKALMTGENIVDAQVDYGQSNFNLPYVSLTLNAKGAEQFADITGKNIKRRLAIVLDGKVYSAPSIEERIPSGRAIIRGQFTTAEANDLAIVLRAGSLPAPVKIIEERTVGPGLGKDSIEKGIRAAIIGTIAVIIFMALYYLIAGLIADLALSLNILMTMGALAYFHGTLTLPGIAGLVLTVGMSVDANVLIFERIREELRLGKSLRSAINAGFDRAFLTIFDSNLTTLIAALILFQFGTGPVKGFATTLSIGIVTSMFTAITVTKLILDFLTISNPNMDRLPMMSVLKATPKINFVGMRRYAYIISIIVIVVGMSAFINKGEKNYGIDFSGGTIQQFKFERSIPTEEVRNVLKEIGLESATIQQYGSAKEFVIRCTEMDPNKIINKFKEAFADNPFEIMRVEKVGPSVGKDLRGKAVKALVISFICMLIYISFRFEMRFAVGGILALVHDVLVSLGFLALFSREISTTVIAALLTIVGYSINDTIVIFDRIRENMKLLRKTTFQDVVNISINETLSRTFLTSFTVFEVLLALYFLGGEIINDFAFTLIVGCISGTYSTIFIAVPVVLDWPSKRIKK